MIEDTQLARGVHTRSAIRTRSAGGAALVLALIALAGLAGVLVSSGGGTASAAGSPTFADLAAHWAPVIYQDTDPNDAHPHGDYITNFNFDGNWDADDNWENLPGATLNGYAYYWVVETEHTWFIGYSLFHPRDWSQACPSSCHENDMEGMLLTIGRDGSKYGQFLLMNTLQHCCFGHYVDEDDPKGITSKDPQDEPGDVEFAEGRPIVYVTSGGHKIAGAARWEDVGFPGDTGIIYGPGAAAQPADDNDRDASYGLIDVQELWSRRYDFGPDDPFARFGRFRGDPPSPNSASAPWGWAAYGKAAPAFFCDPATVIGGSFNGFPAFTTSYSGASYAPGPGVACALCPTDVNADGDVTFVDLLRVLAAVGTTPGDSRWNPAADIDGSGRVGWRDLIAVLRSLTQGGCE